MWLIIIALVSIVAGYLLVDSNKKRKDVKGKVILITGGASGLGLGVGESFGLKGARVVLWDINQQALDRAKQEFTKKKIQVSTYVCDVSDKKDIYRVADLVKKEVGKVDILINNAGIVVGKPFLSTSDEQSEKVISVNLLAIFWTVKAFLPDMLQSSGHLVTIASAAGHTGAPLLTDYCASKYGACGFMDSLRMELRHLKKKNIKFTTVMPFYTNTGMFEGVKSKFPFPILSPDYVISGIVEGVEREDVEVFLPGLTRVRFFFRLFPVWVSDLIEVTLGISSSMDEFKGRH